MLSFPRIGVKCGLGNEEYTSFHQAVLEIGRGLTAGPPVEGYLLFYQFTCLIRTLLEL